MAVCSSVRVGKIADSSATLNSACSIRYVAGPTYLSNLTLDGADSIADQVDEIAAMASEIVWQEPGAGHASGFKPGFRSVVCICIAAHEAWHAVLEGPPRLEALGIAKTMSFAMTRNSLAAVAPDSGLGLTLATSQPNSSFPYTSAR